MTASKRVRLTIFLGVLAALAPLSTDMYLPALPAMQADFSISVSLTQMTLTMTMIGMAAGQILAGPLSDRYGRKKPLLAGMTVFTLSALGCVLSADIRPFLFFRLVMGLSGAFGIVIARAVARDVCEGAELTRFYAILMMVNGLAPILAPVIGSQILLFSSWHAVFGLLTIIGATQVAASFLYRETLAPEKRLKTLSDSFHKFPMLLKDKYFFGHCLAQCFIFGSFFAYISGSSFVFQNIYRLSAQEYGLAFGAVGIGLMFMGSLPAKLAGRVKDIAMLKKSLVVSLIGSFLLLLLFLVKAPFVIVYAVIFITITPLSVIGAASFSLALSKHGKNAGSASALIGFFSMILGGAMMPLVGIAGADNALPMSLLMILGYSLGYIALQKMIMPFHRKEQ